MSNHLNTLNCAGCAFRAIPTEEALGHTNCSEHRPCSGRKYWEPEDCNACNNHRSEMENMSISQVKVRLAKFRSMLINMTTKLKLENPQRIWRFQPIFLDFFKDYIHLDPGRPDYSGDLQHDVADENMYTYDMFDDSCSTEDYNPIEETGLFDEYIIDSNDQVSSDSLTRENICNLDYCAYAHNNAQCNDPIHSDPMFRITKSQPGNSRSNLPTQNQTPKRQRSLSPINHSAHRAISPSNNIPRHTSSPSSTVAGNSGAIPTLGPKLPLTDPKVVICPNTLKCYWTFTPSIHERKGANQMEILMPDPTNTFVTKRTAVVSYKPGSNSTLFEVLWDQKINDNSPYISAANAEATLRAGFGLTNSTADLKGKDHKNKDTKKNFLDSSISAQSGLDSLQKLLNDLAKESSQKASGLVEFHIDKLYSEETFNAINFVNFTDGWTLTPDGYAKFAKDEILSLDNFRDALITHNDPIKCNPQLLRKEKEARQIMLHSFSLIHLQELLTNKIELLPEEQRAAIGLSPDLSKSLCRMQIPQLRYNINRWMIAKMRVRKDIMRDSSISKVQSNVNFMIKQNLWDPNIVPKDAVTQLRSYNNNVGCVAELLGIRKQDAQQHHNRNNTSVNNIIVNTHSSQRPPQKRQRPNPTQHSSYPKQATPTTHTKRGGHTGHAGKNTNHHNRNIAQTQVHHAPNNNKQHHKPRLPQKKFHKGKPSGNSQ